MAAVVDAAQLEKLLEDSEELADIRAVDAAWEETVRPRNVAPGDRMVALEPSKVAGEPGDGSRESPQQCAQHGHQLRLGLGQFLVRV